MYRYHLSLSGYCCQTAAHRMRSGSPRASHPMSACQQPAILRYEVLLLSPCLMMMASSKILCCVVGCPLDKKFAGSKIYPAEQKQAEENNCCIFKKLEINVRLSLDKVCDDEYYVFQILSLLKCCQYY